MKFFELSNHLGNVMATISDLKVGILQLGSTTVIDHYEVSVISAQDYYPFGMSMPGRQYSVGSYRYGFNGKENDNDIKGQGNQQDFGARIYDPRIGRWLSLDPLQKKYPNESHYAFVSNSPLLFSDPDGLDKIVTITTIGKDGKTTITKRTDKDYFDYSHNNTYSGLGYFTKSDVMENYTIDLSKNTLDFSRDITNNREISATEYARGKASAGLKWASGLFKSGDESSKEKYGYMIYGQQMNMNAAKNATRPASGTETLNIDKLISALDAWREFGARTVDGDDFKHEVYQFMKDEKWKAISESVDNLLDAASTVNTAANGYATETMTGLINEAVDNLPNGKSKTNTVTPTSKKGTVYYDRDLRTNIKRTSDTTGQLTREKATDTVPKNPKR